MRVIELTKHYEFATCYRMIAVNELTGCSTTGGNSTRNSGKRSMIFFLMVLAPYSCLLEANQHGTTL